MTLLPLWPASVIADDPPGHHRGPAPETVGAANRDSRLYVRLDPEDGMLLASRATERGMRSATYAGLLIRSHLRAVIPLPKAELLALKRSVAE